MALTPEQLEKVPDNIVKLYEELETFIIQDISRRIAKVGQISDTAQWQYIRAQEFGMAEETLKKKIAATLNLTLAEVDKLFEDSATKSINSDNVLFEQAKLTAMHIESSPELKAYLIAAIKQTKSELSNMCQSLGFVKFNGSKIINKSLTAYYREVLDLANMQVTSGILDYNKAIRNAVKNLSKSGVRVISYESGWNNRADVAVRRAVLTGVNQMSIKMTDHNMNTLIPKDEQYVEVSAHMGARPSHQTWQGRVYKVEGSTSGYPNLYEVTGLGTGDGLCGWGCRHSYFPFIPSISTRTYTDEKLNNIDPKPFEYKGKMYTYYQATQRQREIERAIRQTKREIIGYQAAGLDTDFKNSSILLQRQKEEYKTFSNAAGIRIKLDRQQILGFNKSISQKSRYARSKE